MKTKISYSVSLTEDVRAQLARVVCEELDGYTRVHSDRLQNLEEWRRDVALLPADRPGPWQGSAQLRAPLTRIACNNHTTRLNSMMSTWPYFSGHAEKPEALDLVDQAERILDAKLRHAGFANVARLVHRELPIGAPVGVQVEWVRETTRVPKVSITVDEAALTAAIREGLEPDKALEAAANTSAAGEFVGEVEFEDKVIYEGNRLTVIPFERLAFFPPNAQTHDDLWAVGHVASMKGYELDARAKNGVFYEDAVQKVLLTDPVMTTEERERQEKLEDRNAMQISTYSTERENLYKDYPVFHVCWKDDLNNDGSLEWYLLTVCLTSRTLLGCNYAPYEHGKPTIHVFDYIETADSIVGETVAEVAAVMQDAGTAILNAIVDGTDKIVGAGTFLYDGSASRRLPHEWILNPAQPIQVDNINGIRENPIQSAVAGALPSMVKSLQLIRDFMELVTASSNPALGVETDSQKTLGEVNIVMGQAGKVFENYFQRVAYHWSQVIDMFRSNCAQFAPNEMVHYEVQTSNAAQLQQGEAAILAAPIQFHPTATSGSPDMGARIQRDVMVTQQILQNPVTASNPKLLAVAMQQLLTDIAFPGWQKMNAMIDDSLAAIEQQQQAAQEQQQGLLDALAEHPEVLDDPASENTGSGTTQQRRARLESAAGPD